MLASKAEVFFELGLQKLELARQRDELRRTAITLAGALSKLKAHDDNSPLAIVEFGPDLQLLSWSKGAERMFGWNAPDVVGKRLSELRWMHDEDAEVRSEEHTSELQSLMRISYAVFCLKKKKQ